ncbi:MAG: type II secretion system F family protein, partial [Acidobacteria bacterium]|nr:type II secretion system F family protein [Acidobacteriota bacterium]
PLRDDVAVRVEAGRIAALLPGDADPEGAEVIDCGGRVLMPGLQSLGNLLLSLTPATALEKIRAKLDMAGNPRYIGLPEYLGLKVLSLVVMIPAGLFGLRYVALPGIVIWVAVGCIVAGSFWLPDIVLQRIIEARQSAIRRTLPDVLDLLVVSVEAGVGFDGAVQKVVEKRNGPLEMELTRVLEQIHVGKSRAEAMLEMGQRTQVPDLQAFATAIAQSEAMGMSIARVLRAQANTARERRTQRAREAGAMLPVKLLFPMVFFIFPSLFVVLLGPAVIRIAEVFRMMGK